MNEENQDKIVFHNETNNPSQDDLKLDNENNLACKLLASENNVKMFESDKKTDNAFSNLFLEIKNMDVELDGNLTNLKQENCDNHKQDLSKLIANKEVIDSDENKLIIKDSKNINSFVDEMKQSVENLEQNDNDSNESNSEESDSSESESSSSESESSSSEEEDLLRDEINKRMTEKPEEKTDEKIISVFGQVVLEPNVKIEDEVIILPVATKINVIGKVSSIIEGKVVVVKALLNIPALNLDSTLFLSDRTSLGIIQETFGPVTSPFYVVCLQDAARSENLKINDEIYYAPDAKEHTSYVLMQQVRDLKGSDASWIGDGEPPRANLEYSDDEEERSHKRRNKRKITNNTSPVNKTENIPNNNFPRNCPPYNLHRMSFQNHQSFRGPPPHNPLPPNYPSYMGPPRPCGNPYMRMRPPHMNPNMGPQGHPWQQIAMSFNNPPPPPPSYSRSQPNLDCPSSHEVNELLTLFNRAPRPRNNEN